MVIFNKRLKRAEAWFDEPVVLDGLDIIEFNMCSNPPVGATVKPKPTLVLDLHKNEDMLFGNMKSDTRYKVRRALERDELEFKVVDPISDMDIEQFCHFHNETTGSKAGGVIDKVLSGLGSLDPSNITPYREACVLHLSEVLTKSGQRISYHATYRAGGTACLLHSALRRKNIPGLTAAIAGRANRAHYWWDILHFKSIGDHTYDFGGWYYGLSDMSKIPVADFKAEFGGGIRRSSHSAIGVSLKGKSYLMTKRIAGRILGRDVKIQR